MAGLDLSTAINLAGVYPVWDEGITENISKDGNVTRTVLCKWEDRLTLYANLGATAQSIGGIDVGSGQGLAYPPMPWFFVDEIVMDRQDGQGGMFKDSFGVVGAKYARLKIIYRKSALPIISGAQAKYTLELDFGHEIISVKAGNFARSSDPTAKLPDDEYIPIRVPLVTIKIGVIGASTFPIDKILNAATNPLNSTTFLGAPVNQVLFDGARTLAKVVGSGKLNWDEDLHFLYRGVPWNQVYTGGDGTNPPGWINVTPDPYAGATSDLNVLLPT